jgi:hypothetical protein
VECRRNPTREKPFHNAHDKISCSFCAGQRSAISCSITHRNWTRRMRDSCLSTSADMFIARACTSYSSMGSLKLQGPSPSRNLGPSGLENASLPFSCPCRQSADLRAVPCSAAASSGVLLVTHQENTASTSHKTHIEPGLEVSPSIRIKHAFGARS